MDLYKVVTGKFLGAEDYEVLEVFFDDYLSHNANVPQMLYVLAESVSKKWYSYEDRELWELFNQFSDMIVELAEKMEEMEDELE